MPQTASLGRPGPSSHDGPDVLIIGFVGGTGGASTMMLDLAEGVAGRGLRPKIVVPAWESVQPYAATCRSRGVEVELTPWLQEREPRARAYHDAIRLVRAFQAPVVHYHLSSNVMPGRYANVVRWLRRNRTLATIHHPYDDPAPGTPEADRWAQTAGQVFDDIVCVSRVGLERQRQYGVPAERLHVVYNGIALDTFMNGRGQRVREELGIGSDAPLIVVSARVAGQKRPLDAVSVLSRLTGTYPDAHLVFVGQGPLEPLVRQSAEREGLASRVHLMGHRFDVPDWLAAATVWLLPTESEAFQPCLSVVEAMAAGCAIVTTRCPGDEGILIDGENVLLTGIGDVDAMAAGVGRLLADAGARRRLGEAAQRAAQRFSAQAMVAEYMELYAPGRRGGHAQGYARLLARRAGASKPRSAPDAAAHHA